MSTYTIKDLEHLSGVKAHTIRIWEQRYELLMPQRSDTNIRYYSDSDLKKLLNVALLKDHGFKISKIANMPHEQINEEVATLADHFGDDEQIAELTIAMVDMDGVRFQRVISRNITKWGFEETMIRLIYPFLKRIGVLWVTGSIVPAQEHFVANIIRQKLIAAIDAYSHDVDIKADKFMLFLPEGEMHEMTLLFADYLIKSRKYQTIYLGQSVPLDDLLEVCRIHKPQYALTIITSSTWAEDPQGLIDQLSSYLKDTTVIISGLNTHDFELSIPDNIQIVHSVADFIEFLNN